MKKTEIELINGDKAIVLENEKFNGY